MPRYITNIHDKFIKQILSDKELAVEFLQQYLPAPLSSIMESIFVYLVNGTSVVRNSFTKVLKKLPEDMSTKILTLREQFILEGKERAVQQTILNAYDAGIVIATIRIITGESEQKIRRILARNKRTA